VVEEAKVRAFGDEDPPSWVPYDLDPASIVLKLVMEQEGREERQYAFGRKDRQAYGRRAAGRQVLEIGLEYYQYLSGLDLGVRKPIVFDCPYDAVKSISVAWRPTTWSEWNEYELRYDESAKDWIVVRPGGTLLPDRMDAIRARVNLIHAKTFVSRDARSLEWFGLEDKNLQFKMLLGVFKEGRLEKAELKVAFPGANGKVHAMMEGSGYVFELDPKFIEDLTRAERVPFR
jgi:hypothetical protein